MKKKDIDFYFDIAKLAAARSSAIRLRVGGVVLDSDDNLVAFGYNGTPHNFSNECEYQGEDRLITKDNVIHCEANLIAHAARRGISINRGSVFLTHSPCMQCASLLYQAGIRSVYFLDKFRTFEEMMSEFKDKLDFHWHES